MKATKVESAPVVAPQSAQEAQAERIVNQTSNKIALSQLTKQDIETARRAVIALPDNSPKKKALLLKVNSWKPSVVETRITKTTIVDPNAAKPESILIVSDQDEIDLIVNQIPDKATKESFKAALSKKEPRAI